MSDNASSALKFASVFDDAIGDTGNIRIVELLSTDVPVRITRLNNVLHASRARAQLLLRNEQWIAPLEAVFYPSAFNSVNVDDLSVADVDNLPTIDEACILANPWSTSFFHWIEELAKVSILENYGYEGLYIIPPGPRFIKDSLLVMGVDESRLVLNDHEVTLFKTVWYTTGISAQVSFASFPKLFHSLRDRIIGGVAQTKPRFESKRLWLSRGSHAVNHHRQEVNFVEIEPILSQFDVQVVDMAELSFAEQVVQSAQSTLLAGTHGAAMLHAMFLDRGRHVVECFSPRYINPCIHQICDLLDLDYQQIVHPFIFYVENSYPYEASVKVDPLQLKLSLRSVMKQSR